MRKRLSPDGGRWGETLSAIRQSLDDTPDGPLRPEELAMLKDWYTSCEDAEERRQLGQIITVLGRR